MWSRRAVAEAIATERGVALPAVLLSLAIVTLLATAGFVNAGTEYRINENFHASVEAFYAANSGLSEHVTRSRTSPATVTYDLGDSRAEVRSERLLVVDPGEGTTLFRVEARGLRDPARGGTARRTVSQVALHVPGQVTVNSAITAAGGMQKNGVAGTVSGYDDATSVECPVGGQAAITGLAVPPGGYTQAGDGAGGPQQGGPGPSSPGSPGGFYGDPPIDDSQSGEDLLADSGLDWEGMLNGSVTSPDYIVSRDGWPDFSGLPEDEWPVILVDVDDFQVSPAQSGRGTVIVQENLMIDGAWNWEGLVFVGNSLTSNGVNLLDGALMTGLNLALGESVDQASLGNGTWDYRFDSCAVLYAKQGMGSMATQPGTWTEGW